MRLDHFEQELVLLFACVFSVNLGRFNYLALSRINTVPTDRFASLLLQIFAIYAVWKLLALHPAMFSCTCQSSEPASETRSRTLNARRSSEGPLTSNYKWSSESSIITNDPNISDIT